MIKIKDIKCNDTFYECERGFNDEFVATCDAYRKDNGWAVRGTHALHSYEVDFYVRDGFEAYGPKLYSAPAYI